VAYFAGESKGSGFLTSRPKLIGAGKNCFSPWLYLHRNAIERMFGRLKDFRRIATRYDRLARNFLATVCLRYPLLLVMSLDPNEIRPIWPAVRRSKWGYLAALATVCRIQEASIFF
jgi:hypothetical protein